MAHYLNLMVLLRFLILNCKAILFSYYYPQYIKMLFLSFIWSINKHITKHKNWVQNKTKLETSSEINTAMQSTFTSYNWLWTHLNKSSSIFTILHFHRKYSFSCETSSNANLKYTEMWILFFSLCQLCDLSLIHLI